MNGLTGRVAIVTGSSGAIGGAIALRLASEGARIVVNGRTEATSRATFDSILERGGEAVLVLGDVSLPETGQRLIEAAVERWGRVDILVNNVGGRAGGPFLELPESNSDQVFNANVKSAFFCSQAAARRMADQHWGRIVNFASISLSGTVNQSNYATAKGAVATFTKTLAMELGPLGITVNCVELGLMETPKSRLAMAAIQETLLKRIPLGRAGLPEDAAGAVAFLTSDDAAYITGQILLVGGGMETIGADLAG